MPHVCNNANSPWINNMAFKTSFIRVETINKSVTFQFTERIRFIYYTTYVYFLNIHVHKLLHYYIYEHFQFSLKVHKHTNFTETTQLANWSEHLSREDFIHQYINMLHHVEVQLLPWLSFVSTLYRTVSSNHDSAFDLQIIDYLIYL